MPKFSYVAFSTDGTKKRGVLEADSELAARQLLRTRGLKVIQFDRQSEHFAASWSLRSRLSAKVDLERFFADLAMLMEAGLGLDRALKAVAVDRSTASHQILAKDLIERLSNGKPPSEAFGTVKGADSEVTALIASGEHTGKLAVVFTVIANVLERKRLRRRQMTEAIIYPTFLIVMMCAALLIVTFFLVPALLPLFEGAQKQAPIVLRVLEGVRTTLSEWMNVLAVALIAFVVVFQRMARLPQMKSLVSGLVLSIPIIGDLVRKYTLSRYLQSLAMLLGNGVEMSKALAFATAACPLKVYQTKLEAARNEVINGRRLPDALASAGIFPSAVISLAAIGDETNKLPIVLGRSAELLEAEAARVQNWLLALLSPAITILMGALIGGLVLTVMSAVLSINELSV